MAVCLRCGEKCKDCTCHLDSTVEKNYQKVAPDYAIVENAKSVVFVIDAECSKCQGTGLYVGMAEKNGWAVQCHCCDGTGKVRVENKYIKFEGRKKSKKIIHQVVEANPGIVLGRVKGGTGDEFGGMPYKDWAEGKPFPPRSEMRKYICPAWWAQSTDRDEPHFDECIGCGGSFDRCNTFGSKQKCWDQYDAKKEGK